MQLHYPLNPVTGVEDSTIVWTNGNTQTGTNGSFPPFQTVVYPMDEIIAVITGAGITPSDADLTQLYEAILAIIAAHASNPSQSSLWHVGVLAGSSTSLTTTLSPAPTADAPGINMRLQVGATSTGAGATLDFGFGPKPVILNTGAAVVGGELPTGISYEADFEYDGTSVRLINTPSIKTYYGPTSGTNTLTTTLYPATTSLADGSIVILNPSAPNTGAVTLTPAGYGSALPIRYINGTDDLLPGELQADQPLVTVKIGSALCVVSPPNPARISVQTNVLSTFSNTGNGVNTLIPFPSESGIFGTWAGNQFTFSKTGIYTVNVECGMQISPNSGAGGNYAYSVFIEQNSNRVIGGNQSIGDWGTGTIGCSPSASSTITAALGDVLSIYANSSSTYFESGGIVSAGITITRVN